MIEALAGCVIMLVLAALNLFAAHHEMNTQPGPRRTRARHARGKKRSRR